MLKPVICLANSCTYLNFPSRIIMNSRLSYHLSLCQSCFQSFQSNSNRSARREVRQGLTRGLIALPTLHCPTALPPLHCHHCTATTARPPLHCHHCTTLLSLYSPVHRSITVQAVCTCT